MAFRAPRLPPLPSKTAVQGPQNYERVPIPIPTSAPLRRHDLHQRQAEYESDLGSVCGYISGNVSYPLTCDSAYCGYNYDLNAVGCCESYQTIGKSLVALNSCLYYLVCIDGDEVDGNCDDGCKSNSMILKCTEGSATYCNTFTFAPYGYPGFGCSTSLGNYPVLLKPTTPGVTSYPVWVTRFYSPVPLAGGLSGPTTMTNAPPRVAQSSSALGSHVGEITAAVVGGSFGIVIIIVVIMFFCLRKRSQSYVATKPNLNQEQEQEQGRPLMQHHQEQPTVAPLQQEQEQARPLMQHHQEQPTVAPLRQEQDTPTERP